MPRALPLGETLEAIWPQAPHCTDEDKPRKKCRLSGKVAQEFRVPSGQGQDFLDVWGANYVLSPSKTEADGPGEKKGWLFLRSLTGVSCCLYSAHYLLEQEAPGKGGGF